MSQEIGKVFEGKYELMRLLGEGGMGSVYEARHQLIGRRLAVKFLHPQYASSPEVVTRFHREAQAAARIGHENIIEVTDMGQAEDGSPYIVMEFLEGTDVRGLLDEVGVVPVKRAAHIMVQALSALQAAHNVEIIHRDLKPENIFLLRKGDNPDYVKLLDFGISKFKALETDNARALTQTGTVLGTPHYMSPEQARGDQNITSRSDIYAMGVILYQMVTGHLPFDAPNYNALLIKILTEEAPRPEVLNPELPQELVDTIDRAMHRSEAGRFDSCDEFRRHLLPFAPGSSDITSQLSMSSRTAIREALYKTATPFEMAQSGVGKQRKSRLPLFLGGAGALVAAGVVAAVLLLGGGPPRPAVDPAADGAAAGTGVAVATGPAAGTDAAGKTVGDPAVDEVRIKVTANVPGAVVKIDGIEVGPSPFDGPFIRAEALRTVEVFAAGHEPGKRLLKFDTDQELAFELQPVAETAAVKVGKGGAKPAAKKGGAEAQPAADPEQPPETVEVKVPAKKGGGKKGAGNRNLDYNDPW
jgi:serine/threonine-protein kinase